MSLPTSGMSSSSGPNMSNMFVSQANQIGSSIPGIPASMLDYRSQLPPHMNPFVLNQPGMLGRMPHMGSTGDSIASSGSQGSSLGVPNHDIRSAALQVSCYCCNKICDNVVVNSGVHQNMNELPKSVWIMQSLNIAGVKSIKFDLNGSV